MRHGPRPGLPPPPPEAALESIVGALRVITGTLIFAVLVAIWCLLLIPLLPWRVLRIKACNYFGKVAGSTLMWLSGSPLQIDGREHLDPARPAIYISNHTSAADLFLGMWLAPVGTVGIAKKQVVYYPLLGQIYLLSGHLRIDRGNSARAVESLRQLSEIVRRHRLSVYLWPEGTRSNGPLLPFKKGVVHLAIQTGLPVVPVVVSGAHELWVKNTLRVRPVPVRVQVLPAIDTTGWSADHLEDHLATLQSAFADALPEAQKPLAA